MVGDQHTACPECGDSKQRLGRHWTSGSCSPSLDERQRATIEGMILGRGTVEQQATHAYVEVSTMHDPLAEWISDRLDWLSTDVREVDQKGRQTLWAVKTYTLVDLDRYASWDRPDNEIGRIPPEGYALDAETARVWYAIAGGLEWSGEYDSQRLAVFSAEADDRAAWITRVLDRAGYESTRAGKRVQLPPTEAGRWLDWIGDAVPGVAYKWAETQDEYDRLKS